MKDWLLRLTARFAEAGQALAEYTLILAFVFIACVIALGFLGGAIMRVLSAFTAGLP